jgi:DNA-directed RNA polymerase subunit RPC12/RpoP
MRPLSASELLDAWERSLSEPPVRRALALLAAACPDGSPDEIATLSIGERDWRLLLLREWTFGPQLASVANCPDCGARLEWSVKAADLRVAKQPEPPGDLSLEAAPYHVRFRLPNTLDLAASASCEDAASAREALLERCLSATRLNDQEIAVSDLPAVVAEAIVKQMAEADPQADTQLDLSCPACGHRWQAFFDINSFFWSEINAWAKRILIEVHTLASAYGWRELDILNLSAWRRQFYLNLVGG